MMETLSTNELWVRFDETMMPHRTALYQSARAMLRNATEAEEVVQETYLQAWKSLNRFEPGTNARAWLFAILFNVVRHYRRKWLSRFHFMEDPSTFEKTLVAKETIADSLQNKEILAALGEIPQRYSEVVLLSDVQEFTYREIAETLGLPIGTVMSRLSRGRALLREKLTAPAMAMGIRRARAAGAAG